MSAPESFFVQKLHPKKKTQGAWPVPHQGVTGTTDKTRGRGRLTPTPEWETRSEGSSFRTLPPPNGRTTKRRLPTLPWCLVNGRKRPETFPWSQHSAEPFLHVTNHHPKCFKNFGILTNFLHSKYFGVCRAIWGRWL